jgi:hypothetical protein
MVIGFYRDALLPPGLAPGELDRLLAAGFVEAVA